MYAGSFGTTTLLVTEGLESRPLGGLDLFLLDGFNHLLPATSIDPESKHSKTIFLIFLGGEI